ncbi:MAG: succinate dehydrogenase [Sphingobacteriales bacterium SCN 48-20]|jgi:succinate dehydrogenase / fumarate reductase cytochrome b subunit|uniref:succinate dehydrogenase cytochrome b subunit n=1 Tax=Terrimonas ferruginea TaxID=249 RepID=UPI00040324C2|nr:succinate dehydrogenase cytochrome b subunit [Terrimonas ferruginea]MBN8783094.1 succinate dehydrogenase cytochrome b subunit [Terrimonas ferruginea]ODT91138.1 MAG: succinate dehydrogenase [Sphingobacteriales bacterium SCN 48-20]OJW44269.1 MAG: succinate dehydrogenase [Sphingobacteriales bacterium 48-107]
MKWSEFFTSSIGKKIIMSLSGLFLIAFLVVHVGLNACIWAMDDGVMFNKAAHFMGANVVPRILEIGLFAGFLLHIIQGFVLVAQNNAKRKIGYNVKMGSRGSTWYSKSMGLLGTLLLLFLIMHIAHFWVPSRITGLEPVFIDGKEYHNLYGEMVAVFTDNPLVVALYVIGCISLAWHLLHGFQSAFRTLGLSNHKYIKLIQGLGAGFSIIVPLAFAMMPVSFYFGWV